MSTNKLYRLAAFSDDASGGNPAGVWIGAELPEPETMQKIAADVGYSETAFVAPDSGTHRTIRYFSPESEVPFCGHATIATGVQLGKLGGEGIYRLATKSGEVSVTARSHNGHNEASLVPVEPRHVSVSADLLDQTLTLLGWKEGELDHSIPPATAYAGAWHLVLAVSKQDRLINLDYDFDGLKKLMLKEDLTTLQLIWRERPDLFHARNPFPVGGVFEDPATGAAAADPGAARRAPGLRERRATPGGSATRGCCSRRTACAAGRPPPRRARSPGSRGG